MKKARVVLLVFLLIISWSESQDGSSDNKIKDEKIETQVEKKVCRYNGFGIQKVIPIPDSGLTISRLLLSKGVTPESQDWC